jgi:hypothetical protein
LICAVSLPWDSRINFNSFVEDLSLLMIQFDNTNH